MSLMSFDGEVLKGGGGGSGGGGGRFIVFPFSRGRLGVPFIIVGTAAIAILIALGFLVESID
jgi:hypothetical protein